MFGGVAAALLCIWFYQTATKIHLHPLKWVVGVLILFYGVRYAWTFGVLKPLMGTQFRTHSMLTGVLIELSGVLIGGALAALFRSKVMLKQAR